MIVDMRNWTIIIVGIVAITTGGLPLAADPCVMASGGHACCGRAQPRAVEHCCSAPAPPESATDAGCHCAHTPEVAVVATSQDQDRSLKTPAVSSPASPALQPWGGNGGLAEEALLPGHSPPPVFLLACAFLT